MQLPIGAEITYKWIDDDVENEGYVSFGQEVEDAQGDVIGDTFGVPDERIFYFMPEGKEEMDEYISQQTENGGYDFIITSYETVYNYS
jgi:hypothetical protein